MDFAKIQKFVIGRNEKFVILQDGEPAMVIMSFSDYEKLAAPSRVRGNGMSAASAREEVAALPQRQDEWQMTDAPETEFIADDPSGRVSTHPRMDEIRLEDLPL